MSGAGRLAALIAGSARIVVFTGAGISTESGIPDFRSPQGIWSKMSPILFQDFVASEDMRREAWRRKKLIDADMIAAEPNRGHRAVAELVRRGQCSRVVTQNIDGLHQRSGIAEEHIVELHGNGTYAACLDCRLRHELAPIMATFEADGTLPVCRGCGGIVKTATVSFGQSMPVEAMRRAERAARECDLFLVLGSSLVVYPAAGFPLVAKKAGAALAIVNRDPTEQDGVADLVVHESIGETLGAAVGVE
ncbi:MAG: Sir2 family NAD-dependent protein deacetylase [Gammaproteobacteria bacterium]|nr:Sir2 family NAD-dependent protein deacetylase [Gammaproteobacteria bacterium]